MEHVKNWKTETVYIDIDTGELISKRHVETSYAIIKKTRTVKIENNNGKIKWQYECQKQRQTKLWEKE